MSPQVDNFVHSLVEMAKAQEILPSVEAERDELKGKLNAALDTVQDRELHIIALKSDIESLNNKVRSLEVERDDASFRVLEVEERTEKLERSFQTALEAMDATDRLIQSFKPVPMPEPVKEPEPIAPSEPAAPTTPAEEGSSDTTPMEHSSPIDGGSSTGEASKSIYDTVTSISKVSSGQSESSPTTHRDVVSDPVIPTHSTTDANEVGAVNTSNASTISEPTHGPYFGKRYLDHPAYVPFSDWIAGGGTEENYFAGRN